MRAGLSGARSGLFSEQIRVIREMREADKTYGRTDIHVRPRFGVWENVPGALSSGRDSQTGEKRPGEDFRIVLESFLKIEEPYLHVVRPAAGRWEYAGAILGVRSCVAWVVWDAQYLGVPQRRRRVFLVADFAGHSPIPILFIQQSLQGILRRSEERGKPLPEDLERVLRIQSKLILPDGVGAKPGSHHINQRNEGLGTQPKAPTEWLAFTANQRDEVRDLHGVSAALCAEPGMKQQTFVAGFSAGAGATAGSIGYAEECAPTLKGSAGGSCMPSVLCLNDQGGKIMDCTEDISGTLRAEEHGHQPLILSIQQSEAETETDRSTTAIEMTNMCGGNQPSLFENHGIDARYRGPLSVAPTLPARAGTGGNNLSLVAQPVTSQVYCRQRVDVFQNGEISSTESARQYKDATDLVCQIPADGSPLQDALAAGVRALIRRLTPLECERLQGFPDGWTDIPGASDSARYRALGNSVAIPCVEYLIRRIVIVLLLGFRGFL